MSSFQLKRLVCEIDAGHRLLNHAGKCGSPHGHRYKIEVHVTGSNLDRVGLVVDFGVLKDKLGGWITKHWDHTMILERGDPLINAIYGHPNNDRSVNCAAGDQSRPCFVISDAPSAENLARYLFEYVCPLIFMNELGLNQGVCPECRGVSRSAMNVLCENCNYSGRINSIALFTIDYVQVWETPNCAAIYPSPEDMIRKEVDRRMPDVLRRITELEQKLEQKL